jgi:cation diffusion facilitator CzcD-associated flavoprotein CzcO
LDELRNTKRTLQPVNAKRRCGRPLRVAIIGAGFGGIAAAVKLKERTSAAFVIFEQSAGVGGTWRDNRYPGCEVDVHSHAYSFSFARYQWLRTHATQSELLKYAEHVVDLHGLRECLRLNTKVTDLSWDAAADHYILRTASGEHHEFDVVISAVGFLNIPRYPDWPGLDSFEGICFHTARWQDKHDFNGKAVAVVGTGSTAAQLVPAIAAVTGKLYIFQREPGWIEPKNERRFSRAELTAYRRLPLAQRLHRAWLFYQAMKRFEAFDVRSRRQRQMRDKCLDYIATTVRNPGTRAAVTPTYSWGCKRPVLASTFYQTLNRENVELVPQAVASVTPSGVIDATGVERRVDILILSTGFQSTNYLAELEVKGSDGRTIHDVWADRPAAFLGITVSGFPNFFILYGPNTNGGLSIIAQLERQAEVAAATISRMERNGWRVVDTDTDAQRRYVAWIDRRIRKHASATEAGCHNYYHSASGANVTQWPSTHLTYFLVTRVLPRTGIRPNKPLAARARGAPTGERGRRWESSPR